MKELYTILSERDNFVSVHPMAGSSKRVAMKYLIKTYSKVGWIVLEDKASDVYSEDVAQELS